jgi:hypothetical protein
MQRLRKARPRSDGSIEIRGYARDVFPPADFHSATLAGDSIFIIGCLGYPEQRIAGRTPAYRLALDTMAICPVETSGEAPGWLQRHSAKLSDDGHAIIVRGGDVWLGDKRAMQENIDAWSLDIASGRWTRSRRFHVDYELTELGETLLEPVMALVAWAEKNEPAIAEAQKRFDEAPEPLQVEAWCTGSFEKPKPLSVAAAPNPLPAQRACISRSWISLTSVHVCSTPLAFQ